MPTGTKRADAEKVALDVQARLQDLEGLKNTFAKVGGENQQNEVEVRVVFNAKTQRKQGLLALQKQARERLQGLSGSWLVLDPPPIEGIGGEAPISVFFYGENISEMLVEAENLRQKIEKIPGVAGMRMDTDPLSSTYEVSINQQNVSFAGTDSQVIDLTGRLALTGLETGTVGSDNLKFLMRLREEDRVLPTLWGSLLVPSMKGPQSMSLFAQAVPVEKPLAIDREKRSRKIRLSGSMDRTQTFGEVLAAVEKEVAQVKAPYFAEVSGDKEVFQEMIESFAIAIAGSLFFIFIILAAQFENLVRPFIILLSLPLAMIGGFVALFLFNMQLAMGALIGLILLIGLAAKNGILLVDAIGEKEKLESLRVAVSQAVKERARPIVMTSMAMIFGMIPTAVMRGGGSEFRSPMAIAIMGGVISSTLLSFLVIPAIFGLIESLRKRKLPRKLPTTLSGVGVVLVCLVSGVSRGNGLQPLPPSDMKEWYTLMGSVDWDQAARMAVKRVEETAEGTRTASRLAMLGGARIEVGREWYFPGVVQGGKLPLYSPQGTVEVDLSATIVPKAQNVFSFGWMIPLFNMQALGGLELADLAQSSVGVVQRARKDETSLVVAQDLFRYEALLTSERLQKTLFENMKKRTSAIETRKMAGVASGIEKSTAAATEEQAKVSYLQALGERERFVLEFENKTGHKLKETGYGIPSFPFEGKAPFEHFGTKALQAVADIQIKNSEVQDQGLYPTVGLEMGYKGQYYPGATDPQKFVALRAKLDVLDAGSRIRARTQAMEPAWDILEKKKDLEQKLMPMYRSLVPRKETAEKILVSTVQSEAAAQKLLNQVEASFAAGVVKFSDVRDAEEGLLRAKIGRVQAALGLQAVHLESLYLTGKLAQTAGQ